MSKTDKRVNMIDNLLQGLPYVKMDAQGNDFIFLDGIRHELPLPLPASEIKALASRDNTMGGCDQILICESPSDVQADFFMRVYNADASEADQCGNGARCFLHYVCNQGLTAKEDILLQTAKRNINLKLLEASSKDSTNSADSTNINKAVVELNMGEADFDASKIIKPEFLETLQASNDADTYRLAGDGGPKKSFLDFYAVSFGNPHLIRIVVADEHAEGLTAIKGPDEFCDTFGENLSKHPTLIDGANIGFVTIDDIGATPHLILFTYERGAGKTLACGSNACAAFAVAHKHFNIGSEARITMRGGTVTMRAGDTGDIYMSGEVKVISSGLI